MKRAPALWRVWNLYRYIKCNREIQTSAGFWVPERFPGRHSFRNRVKLAWGVFMGRYDAVVWPNPCR